MSDVKEDVWSQISRWADRLIRLFCFGLFLASLIFNLAFAAFGYGSTDPQIQLRLLVSSAFLAVFGWMWSGFNNRNQARKAQAVAMIEYLQSEQVLKLKRKVYKYLEARNEEKERKKKRKDKDKETDDPVELPSPDADILLGMHETAALAIWRSALDEEIMRRSQRVIWARLYNGLKDHIDELQAKDACVYCHFTHYAVTWAKERSSKDAQLAQRDRDFP